LELWSFISGLHGVGHCKMFTPVYTEAAAKMAGKVRFAKLNCDEHSSTAIQCKVTGTPTVVVYINGKEARPHSWKLIEGCID